MNEQDEQRFWAKVTKTDTCWIYTGATTKGYGRFWLQGKSDTAHRVAYELEVGPIPDGLQLDHLCRVRACVRPSHLEPVTLAQNVLRGTGLSAQNATKTHCSRNHPLSGDNVWVRRTGARVCRTCQRARVTAWRARQAVAA